jgi:hypothetical protein
VTKRFEVCKDVDHLKAGESFEWVNSTDKDCTVFDCKPPLEHPTYVVKKHSHTPAKVQNGTQVGNYDYDCKCDGIRTNPRIIIGTD